MAAQIVRAIEWALIGSAELRRLVQLATDHERLPVRGWGGA